MKITSLLFTKQFFRNTLLEFSPILLFALAFSLGNPFMATKVLMLSTLVVTVLAFYLEKRIPLIALYVAFLNLVFGFVTLHSRNIHFIEMRDTVYDLTLSFTIFVGLLYKKNVIKLAMKSFMHVPDVVWHRLAVAWGTFFFIAATLNEIVRHNYDVHAWFQFKMSFMLVNIIFGISALYFATKEKGNE